MNNAADAIVVGSGAAGGWAAKELTEAGMRVLLLEAGPERTPAGPARAWATRLWRHARGVQPVQEMQPKYWNRDPDLFVTDARHGYSTPPDKPFAWIRGRQLGGRTPLWSGITLRLSDYELAAAERDGHGPSWPLRHRDLAPWYDRVERFLRIHGTREGLPQVPDGRFAGARPLTAAERGFSDRVAAVWPDRRLIPSRGLTREWRDNGDARCTSAATIEAARATGRLRVRTGAAVSHLVPGGRGGRAGGVLFLNAATGAAHEARARLIVLCASTIETIRILLTTRQAHPELRVDESDCLGRYLMDRVVLATLIEVDGVPYERPAPFTGADQFLVPRFQNLAGTREPYLRGFCLKGGIQRSRLSGRRGRPARGLLTAHGEMLPRRDNRVELGGNREADGLPGLHISCTWGDNERTMHDAMDATVEEMVRAGGGRTVKRYSAFDRLPGLPGLMARMEKYWFAPPPGAAVHEVGGARMGDDPRTSVVDARNRCWGMPNVLVTDGACWPTSGWQPPTLTIMALTARACALAAADLRRG